MDSLPSELVQKCLEFLPFAEVHAEVKQVSKATRKAARMALTRGRWRPFRYVAEQGLAVCTATGALKLDTDTFTVVRDDAASAVPAAARKIFLEAWALEPSLVMRIICLDWDTELEEEDEEGRYQAFFLNIVEPSIDGRSRIVGACESAYSGCTWEAARKIPRFFPRMLFFWWALIGQRKPDSLMDSSAVGDGLKDWADLDRVVNFTGVFIDESEYLYGAGPGGYGHEAKARAWSANWVDREKASRFVAAAAALDEEEWAKEVAARERRYDSEDGYSSEDDWFPTNSPPRCLPSPRMYGAVRVEGTADIFSCGSCGVRIQVVGGQAVTGKQFMCPQCGEKNTI